MLKTHPLQDFFATHGAVFQENQLSSFGKPVAELQAACTGDIVSPLLHLGALRFFGEDAQKFLHGQLTSDVNKLATNTFQHTSWCSAKGRMLANFMLFGETANYTALLSSDLVESTLKRLQIYVFRSKLSLADISSEHLTLGLSGKNVARILQENAYPLPDKLMGQLSTPEITVLRLEENRFILIVPIALAKQTWEKLAGVMTPVGQAVWQWLDIQAACPLITEATQEAFLPQMIDYDRIGGLSFNKGCYPGQEVIARSKYQGKIKRHLYGISTDHFILPASRLFSKAEPDQSCGMLINCAPSPAGGFESLAVIHDEHAQPEELLFETDKSIEITDISRCRPAD